MPSTPLVECSVFSRSIALMMTRLSAWLGARWTPKMQFVEVYLNRKYMGLYLLSETVKVGGVMVVGSQPK